MNGAELAEVPNLEEGGEIWIIVMTDSGEREGSELENSTAPAVEGGPLDQGMENVITRTRTGKSTEKEWFVKNFNFFVHSAESVLPTVKKSRDLVKHGTHWIFIYI